MKSKIKFNLIFLLLLFSTVSYSQTDKEKRSLSAILDKLEQEYNYHFVYADDVIEGIAILEPPDHLTFREVIAYLRQETGLNFQFHENKYITINSENGPDYICGYTIDTETRTPVAGVTVVSANDHTVSDAFGFFRLKREHPDQSLSFSHIGYNALLERGSRFDNSSCPNIYLVPRVETLSEIIINGFITRGIDKIADGSLNINFNSFDILPGLIEPDVLQTVQALPGVQSVNETVSDITIRGGTNDQNLILWDGIKMYQSGHFFGLISMFNPLMTNNITLIKNGTNADLSDGVSGTLDMYSASAVNTTFKSSIGFNFINADIFTDIPLGKRSSVQLSGRKSINNITRTPTYNKFYDRILQDAPPGISAEPNRSLNSFDFYDASVRWIYDISKKDRIQANFLFAANQLDAEGRLKESDLKQQSIAEGIKYERNWSDKFKSSLQLYETDYRLRSLDDLGQSAHATVQENKVSETSLKLNTWYKSSPKLSFLNGYQFTETGITNATQNNALFFSNRIREVLREHAVYSQVNYIFNADRTTVKAGIRCNYIEKFNSFIVEPRFSLNQQITEHLSVEVLGEFKHQLTTQIINSQLDFLGIEKRRWFLADNINIPVITSRQLSAGINYSKNNWLLSLDGFWKEVKGISSLSQGFLNQYQNVAEKGSYEIRGIDFLINKKLQNFTAWLSYSFANNRYTFKNLPELTFPSNLDINHTVTFGSSYTTGNLKLSLGVNWHSGIPTTRPVPGNELFVNEFGETLINYEPANSSRLQDYLRLDASALYDFNLSRKFRAHLGVSVWNILNHKNSIGLYYTVENNAVIANEKRALFLTPNMTFRVSF